MSGIYTAGFDTGPTILTPQSALHGGQVLDFPHLVAMTVRNQFAPQLNPYTMMSTATAGTVAGTIQLQNPLGCDVATGADFEIQLPILSAVTHDVFGGVIPGSAAFYQNIQTEQTTPGYSVAIGPLSTDSGARGRLPFVTDFYVGDAIGRKEWGLYDWIDQDGNLHKAVGKADVTVNKPEINWLYNASQFFIDPTTGEANILLDGEAGILAGENIIIYPGPNPSTAPTITMESGGVIDDGIHLWAYSWRSTLADASTTTTALTPTSSGKAGGGFSSAQVQGDARPDAKKYDALLIWRTAAADKKTFKLVDTVTTSIDAPWTYADNTTDGSLGDTFAAAEPRISVMPWIVQTADPPASINTPAGQYTFGHGGQRSDLTGFTYDGNSGTGAYHIGIVNEDHQFDIEAVYGQKSDGSFYAFGSIYNRFVDWVNHPIGETEGPSISVFTSGVSHAWGGHVTAVVSHDPTDADIAKDPYLIPTEYADGTMVVRQDADHKSSWYRANNEMNRLANETLFAGVDASGETINHGEGDLGYGTDGSVWVCTTAGTPGTWQTVPTGGVIGAFVWTANTPSIWAEADTTPVKVVFDQGTDTTGGSIWTASDDHFTIPSDGYYSFGYNVTIATNDFTGDGNPFRPRIGMRIDPMVTIDQPDVEDQVDYGTTTVTDYPQRFYHFNSSREAYFHTGDTVILFTSGGDGGGETGYIPNGALLFNHSAWIRKIG